jgi:hypothetical protein
MVLNNQLDTYILDVHSNIEFSEFKGIGGLAMKKKNKDIVYPLMYLLIKLPLILPISTATV